MPPKRGINKLQLGIERLEACTR